MMQMLTAMSHMMQMLTGMSHDADADWNVT